MTASSGFETTNFLINANSWSGWFGFNTTIAAEGRSSEMSDKKRSVLSRSPSNLVSRAFASAAFNSFDDWELLFSIKNVNGISEPA